jgi:NADH-quinone oxidoreductase subunit E
MSDLQTYEPVPNPLQSQPDFAVPVDLESAVDEVISHYPQKRSASLMLLHAIQERFGYVSEEAVHWVAGKLNLQPINVLELVTFYPMLQTRPVGKWHLKVCRTLSCALAGSYGIHKQFCEKLGLDAHAHGPQTTKDGQFTVEFVECLAACGTAPVLMCNETLHENVSESKADEIMKGCQ